MARSSWSRAAQRARIVEGGDEIALGGGPRGASSIAAQGVSRSDSDMQQKSWPIRAPAAAEAAWKAEMPGMISTATAARRLDGAGERRCVEHFVDEAAMA